MKKLIIMFLITHACMSWGSTILQQNITEIAYGSELIFEGSVIGIKTIHENKRIYTLINFKINDVISGNYTKSNIELKYLGGKIGDQELRVDEMNMPSMGEQGVYFVESLQHTSVHPLRGWGQGHFKIIRNKQNQRKEVLTSNNKYISALKTNQPTTSINSKNKHFNSKVAIGITLSKGQFGRVSVTEFKEDIKEMLE